MTQRLTVHEFHVKFLGGTVKAQATITFSDGQTVRSRVMSWHECYSWAEGVTVAMNDRQEDPQKEETERQLRRMGVDPNT